MYNRLKQSEVMGLGWEIPGHGHGRGLGMFHSHVQSKSRSNVKVGNTLW